MHHFSAADHRKVFAIALPMIISNIAAPLLGLVDTAIIGHLPDAIYLSAVAIGALAINFIYLLAIFLRMSTTGVVAQAYGAQDRFAQQRHFSHGLIFAAVLGLFMLLAQPFVIWLLWQLVSGSEALQALSNTYVRIRLWGSPAALANLVVLGVLLGRQQSKLAMLLVILTNLVNVVLDIVLIIILDMHVAGAAWASVTAEWVTALIGIWLVMKSLHMSLPGWPRVRWHECRSLFLLNQDILIRSLVLQLCMAMMTAYASYYGQIMVAVNAVLMQFLMLISLGLDGIAYATEALLGQAKGQRRSDRMRHWFWLTLFWSTIFALLYSAAFVLFGRAIISLITNIPDVLSTAIEYLPWIMILPLLAHWSYFFDGVYIGLSESKAMRDSMILAALFGFLPAWWLTQAWQNHGLWFALSVFMLGRGLFQAWLLKRRAMLEAPFD